MASRTKALTWILRLANRLSRLTALAHVARAGLLIALAAALLAWGTRHTETSFADGLRYIHQAERIAAGSWRDGALKGTDHPLHPLLIAAVHRLAGGDGPSSWQQAAFWLSFACTVALVIPTYLLSLDLFGRDAAWPACLLVIVNPLASYIVVNVLSESTFLLPWTFGLWAGVRFLRSGHLRWMILALGFGSAAYLTRPEGLLLSLALLAALLVSAVFRPTRLDPRRWWQPVVFVVAGMVALAGPFVALRGGLGTKPGIARVLGLAPPALPLALERERPLPVNQPDLQTYKLAIVRMLKVFRAAVTPALLPFALLGMLLLARRKTLARATLFVAMVVAASAFALVRLHATGGYCTTRHGLVAGMLLTVVAAGGLAFFTGKVTIPARWIGLVGGRVGIPAPVWSLAIVALILASNQVGMPLANAGPFAVYHATASWLDRNTSGSDNVLDMTDWSLYLSRRSGYHFADVYRAPADSAVRWIVVREPHIEGRWPYTKVIRELIAGRAPTAVIPPAPVRGSCRSGSTTCAGGNPPQPLVEPMNCPAI